MKILEPWTKFHQEMFLGVKLTLSLRWFRQDSQCWTGDKSNSMFSTFNHTICVGEKLSWFIRHLSDGLYIIYSNLWNLLSDIWAKPSEMYYIFQPYCTISHHWDDIMSIIIMVSRILYHDDTRNSNPDIAYTWYIYMNFLNIHNISRNMHSLHAFLRFVAFWYKICFIHICQGYVTGTGQSYDCPSASEVTLKGMGQWITWIH